MRQYYLSPEAEQDIDDAITYLAAENLSAADQFLESLFAALDTLSENPHLGHIREDLTVKPVKFWTFKWHYLIIYLPENPIEIVRILSGHRDLMRLL